jgi:predicted permease
MRDALLRDVRYAIRSLLKARNFTAIVVLTLALGLGANTAVFGVLNAVVLTPLPYPEPDRLIRIYETEGKTDGYFPAPGVLDLRERARTFDVAPVYTYSELGADLTDRPLPERVRRLRVGAGYFEVLRVAPALGRTFQQSEERGDAQIAIVSDRIWREYFGASPDAIGRSLSINSVPHQVVGVMPASFQDPIDPETDLWVTLALRAWEVNNWGNYFLSVIGRLRGSASMSEAQAEASAIAAAQGVNYRDREPPTVRVIGLQQDLIGRAGRTLWILLGAVTLLLLIACVNVATLFLARGAARQGELAVRAALGCSRAGLVRQLLIESLVVALAGAAAGLLIARLAGAALLAAAPVPEGIDVSAVLDMRVFAFGFAAALGSGLLFGAAPALEFARPALDTVLREAGRSGTGGIRQARLRTALVAGQIALAMLLLVGAGLLIRTMAALARTDLGFDARQVATFELHLPEGRYSDPARRARLYADLLERLGTLPGVRAAGAVSRLPATGPYHAWGTRRLDRAPDEQASISPNQRVVEGQYFEALGIHLIEVRLFGSEDRAEAPLAVVVSRQVVERLFPEGGAVGTQIRSGGSTGTIVGVVDDLALSARGERAGVVYRSHTQFAANRNWPLAVVISTDGSIERALNGARTELAALDPALVLFRPQRLADIVGRGVAQERFAVRLLAVFAGLALLLGAVGVYGVLSYSVSRRRREIGIRLALGVPRSAVRRHVVSEGSRVAIAGVCLGAIGALAATRWLESLVFGVGVRDPLVFGVSAIVLALAALAACAVPATAATRVNPLEALRD